MGLAQPSRVESQVRSEDKLLAAVRATRPRTRRRRSDPPARGLLPRFLKDGRQAEPARSWEEPSETARLSEWMSAAQAGNADAYHKLLTAIQPRIRAIVRSRIQDGAAAADVVQNTLLSIHRGRATYRAERPFGPWMGAIVRNSIIDHFRECKRRGERETSLPVDEWPDEGAEESGVQSPLAPELQHALAGLPEKQREAVTLIQIEGLSVAEAALRAGVSPGALKVRAHRGYRAMREALAGSRTRGAWHSAEPASDGPDSRGGGPT